MVKIIKNVPTAIIYTRVSSKEQVDGFSLESQERACINFAQKNNLEILKIFQEEGESAKTTDRTQLQNMLSYIDKNYKKIGKLIIYKVDRLARKNEDYVNIKIILRKYGVEIISVTENIENTPQGKFMELMLSGFAELDNDIRSQRTIEGMKTRLLNGLWSGKAPIGYKNTTNSAGEKIIELDQEKAPLIKKVFEEYTKGIYSFEDLAKKMNALGLKSFHGKKIPAQLIVKILKNPLYYGKIEVPVWEIYVQGRHEPIISEKIFNDAQKIMHGGKLSEIPRNKNNPDFPLRGIKCGGCGKSISGGWKKGKTKKYAYYGCVNKDCPQRIAINKNKLENEFSDFLAKLTIAPGQANILKEAIKVAFKIEIQAMANTNRKLESEIESLKIKNEKLLDLKLRDVISDEDFKKEKNKIKTRINELELSKQESGFDELNVEAAIDFTFEFIRTLPKNWKMIDIKEQKILRELLFPKNLKYKYPGIETPELACFFKLIQESDEKNQPLGCLTGIGPV